MKHETTGFIFKKLALSFSIEKLAFTGWGRRPMGPLPDRYWERSLDDAPHTALASSQFLIATSLSECRKQIMKCMRYEQMNFTQLAASCGPSTIEQPRLLMNAGAPRWWADGWRQGPVPPALSQLLQYSGTLVCFGGIRDTPLDC